MIAILDYDAGNTTSIRNALDEIDAASTLTNDPDLILNCSHLIVPGVGAFSHAMNSLRSRGLNAVINEFAQSGKPILGICLGYQLFQKESFEHGKNEGLGFFPGSVERLITNNKPIPHIGWSEVDISADYKHHPLLKGIIGNKFYFVHSFGVQYSGEFTGCGLTSYDDCKFYSVSIKDNIMGVQFHPEKSSQDGLRILKNFKSL